MLIDPKRARCFPDGGALRADAKASESGGGHRACQGRPVPAVQSEGGSPLWRCAKRHAKELGEAGRLRRAVERQVIERFLACGDPHYGFARIYCDACGHDYLLAYSCKTRYFCLSCRQKRVLLYGEWVEQNVLAPVPHRQYVFTLPRLLRPMFGRRRAWLVDAYAEGRTKLTGYMLPRVAAD